ncbi:hypothetical protein GGTG_05165 [Gaeumannomyces tritici R3-111a-1]|uniref:Uncharacterized protein n=1 Tax=Gaeumannomyces tritici (strain R3-111a-1) TaxID=644352 RepID=J3NV52_GAET3|nr:hypothetical protein GGTG_05165 [Gaeumannomyces tritici R3-111a-1]EJT75228.1 hypothetical protein GGTG_05165 [Gaeumannomyces tritici R3-111a-1]
MLILGFENLKYNKLLRRTFYCYKKALLLHEKEAIWAKRFWRFVAVFIILYIYIYINLFTLFELYNPWGALRIGVAI